ncbi:hypothetical protein PFISCL1PPCAC_19859, partial [Pristionchus fissidentatus]
TEGLVDGKICLDNEHRSSSNLHLLEDVSSSSVQDTVDSSNGLFRALNLDEVHRLKKTRLGSEHGCIHDTASSGNDLSTSTMNGISVQSDVVNIEADSSHVLVTQHSLLGGPLESSNNGILDLIKVLYSLGYINQKVGSGSVR